MNISEISSKYEVRKLTEKDVDIVYELAAGNPLFYEYCPPFVTKERVLEDINFIPPKVAAEDKYFIGFYKEEKLVAIMDFVFKYPDERTAYIGLFMMSSDEQGKGTGSKIIEDYSEFIKAQGYPIIRLAFAKGNPQSEAFWTKNGFKKSGKSTDMGEYVAYDMQKTL